MPPKVKITREDIVNAGYALARECGADAVNARSVAKKLGCSTQPVFSNFAAMEDLKRAVIEKAEKEYAAFVRRESENSAYPPYKASGMAYINWARTEKELFKLLFMRQRNSETGSEKALFDDATQTVARYTGLTPEEARLFHLEMWAFVHGIASMFATGFLELDEELVSRTLSDVYLGLKSRFLGE